jgi:hypothetical protein
MHKNYHKYALVDECQDSKEGKSVSSAKTHQRQGMASIVQARKCARANQRVKV